MEWILEDWPSMDIVAQIVQKWNLSERQAKRYLADAREEWVKDEDVLTDQKRRMKIESLKKLKRSMKDQYKGTPYGMNAILRIEKAIAELEGIRPARKIELGGRDGKPISVEATSTILILPSNGRELTDGKQASN